MSQKKLDINPISQWSNFNGRPFMIAGPCSAESEEQMLTIAKGLKPLQIQLFRAGIWKPRTRPGAFEGHGEEALKWLMRVKEETGIPVATEVANGNHVEACLKHGVDVLWIGARSTVNPFTVQEIADALKGTDIPVLIKNPVNPDIDLWIGAIERIHHAGIHSIAALHRGFSSYEKTMYRNKPMWEIPVELKRRLPEIPIICDPSHICGVRDLIRQVSQQALDMNFEGLMIETHHDPEEAWSDKDQQVTPEALKQILQTLIVRVRQSQDVTIKATLEELRELIDKYDEDLIRVLKDRMDIVRQIGLFKKENNITILQPSRWDEIIATRQNWANSPYLSDDLIHHLFELIHKESILNQTRIMNDGTKTDDSEKN